MTTESAKEYRRKALFDLGLDLPGLSFVQRDSLSLGQSVRVHEVDRTPVVVDPDIGASDGIREQCFVSHGLDVGGKASTGDAGQLTWKLSKFICETSPPNISELASFVATAQSDSPIVLTTRTVSTGNDLVIEVFSWDMNGNPAPNVQFAWRCWAEDRFIVE